MKCFLYVLLVINALSAPLYADEKIINWFHADFPPGFIGTGPLKGSGYEDYLEKLFRQQLTEYEHRYFTANYSRILEEIRTVDACCVALIRNPEREQFIEYTQPTMLTLANGVIILKERFDEFAPFIDAGGYISIYSLFSGTDLRMGVAQGRRYGGGVDGLLNDYPDHARIVVRSGKDVLRGLLKMMSHQRHVDYAIGYPHELSWLNYEEKFDGDFLFLPVKEMPKYIVSQIGCSKNKWGKKVVARLNKVLAGQYNEEYKKRYQQFLPPELIPLHERYIGEIFPVKQ